MQGISMEIQDKINTFKAKYATLGILVSIVYDQRNDRISLVSVQGNIKKFTVPDCVEMIGENCFRDNKYIEEVIIRHKGIDLILESAFENCTNLKIVDMSESGVTSIGESAFSGCVRLHNIKFSKCLVDVGYQLLMDCSQLVELCLPESLKYASQCMCYNCTALKKVKHSFRLVGAEAFKNTDLGDFDFNGVQRINSEAFYKTRLTNIILRNVEVSSNAFSNLKNDVELIVIDNVRDFVSDIGKVRSVSIFSENNIKDIIFENAVKIPELAFMNCVITNIKGMEKIEHIGNKAFLRCTVHDGLKFDNVKYIGKSAFCMAHVNFGDKLELGKFNAIEIEEEAFMIILDTLGREKYTDVIIYNASNIGFQSFYNTKYIASVTIEKADKIYNILGIVNVDLNTEKIMVNMREFKGNSLRFSYEDTKFEVKNTNKITKVLLDMAIEQARKEQTNDN